MVATAERGLSIVAYELTLLKAAVPVVLDAGQCSSNADEALP